MPTAASKRDVAVSMRFREEDLGIIDRGAKLNGLSRTEFFRQAALHRAQLAMLNETVVRFSPEGFDDFIEAIEKPAPMELSERMRKVFSRKAPWEG
jgi:uncharacterized protein (DUF1778 family)